MNTLQELRTLLNAALDVLEEERVTASYPDFTLDPTLHPCDKADNVPSARMYQARQTALAAMGQIKACIQPASEQVFENTLTCYDMVSLYTCAKAGVFDVLAAEGVDPNIGLRVDEIVARLPEECKLSPKKLSRLLRLCAATHYARETSPDVFANTRLSASLYLKTGDGNHIEKSAVYYWLDAVSRNGFKATIRAYETWTDAATRDSTKAEDAAWCRGAQFPGSFWAFLGSNPAEMQAFGIGMTGFGEASQAACLQDYDWAGLGECTIVDVGGGRGSFSLPLIQQNSNLKLVLQDRPDVVPEAEKYFQQALPTAIKDGRVQFQPHDFFLPNPQTGDDKVYLLRWILHDWSDPLATQILKSLSSVMTERSRVLLIDSAIVACQSPSGVYDATEFEQALRSYQSERPHSGKRAKNKYEPLEAPYPLGENFDSAARIPLGIDVAMDCWFGGSDRTLADLCKIARTAGMVVSEVTDTRSSQWIVELRKA